MMDAPAKVRNNSIDIFRYIAAVLVIAHHTDVLLEIHPLISYLVSQVIPRIAVPFFFAVAGYYYTIKLESGRPACAPYLKRLLKTYAAWSLIYFAADFLETGTLDIREMVTSFLIFGSEYHFWFFPSMFLSVLVSTLAHRMKWQKGLIALSLVLYLLGCLGHVYYVVGGKLPGLSALYEHPDFRWFCHAVLLGLPCFVCGTLVRRTEKFWRSFNCTIVHLAAALALFLGEILVLKLLDWARSNTMSVSLYLLMFTLLVWLLQHPAPKLTTLSAKCRTLANVSYYSHVLFITLFNVMNKRLFSGMLTPTVKCLFVLLCTFVLGMLLSKSKSRIAKLLSA